MLTSHSFQLLLKLVYEVLHFVRNSGRIDNLFKYIITNLGFEIRISIQGRGKMSRIGDFYQFFSEHQEEFIKYLITLAKHESPSREKLLLDKAANFFTDSLTPFADSVKMQEGEMGPTIMAGKGSGEKKILILGHLDTVWPVNSENKPPLVREEKILRGPGVLDMKGGLCLLKSVFEAYDHFGITPQNEVSFLVTPMKRSAAQPVELQLSDMPVMPIVCLCWNRPWRTGR
jgi:hypothetical protein